MREPGTPRSSRAAVRLATAKVAAYGLAGTMHDYPTAPLARTEWMRLMASVRQQRLTGMLVGAIREQMWPATEEQQAQALDAHVDATSEVLQLEWALLDAVERLEQAGVQPRVLKGSAVAHLDYPRPHERVFGDVDLLIRPEEFDRAVATLTSDGFRRRYPQPRPGFDRRFSKGTSFITPAGFELDLHRTFVMGPYGLMVDLRDVWAAASAFRVGGRDLAALSAELRFLHACFHAALGDVEPRLVPQRDVVQMLLSGRLDLDVVRALMSAWRAEAVVAHAVCLSWATLAIADEVALSAWAQHHVPSSRDRRYLGVYRDPAGTYAAKELAALAALPRIRDKVAFLRALLLPEREYIQGRHSGRSARVRCALRAVHASGRTSR